MEKKTDYVQMAVDVLPGQFNTVYDENNPPTLIELVENEAKFYQELEDRIYTDLYLGRMLKYATGYNLKKIGESVGLPKSISGPASTDDEVYRALIYAKIAENNSAGTRPEIYNLLRLLGAEKIFYQDVYPATINVNITGDLIIDILYIKTAVESASQPIQVNISQNFSGNGYSFGFRKNPNARGFRVGKLGKTR